MRVAAIIPCHNAAPFVREAIASARGQSRAPDEIICVDDGSTDETWPILEAESKAAGSESDLRIFRNEANRGAAAARNAAIAQTDADWLAFLDADDIWLPHRLSTQLAHLSLLDAPHLSAARSQPDLIHSDCFVETRRFTEAPLHSKGDSDSDFDLDLDLERSASSRRIHSNRRIPASDPLVPLFVRNFVAIPTVLVRREAVLRAGGFDERVVGTEDYGLWLALAASGAAFAYIPEPLARYRRHAESTSANHALILENEASMLERMLAPGGVLHGAIPKGRARCRILSIYFALAAERIASGRVDDARHTLECAMRWAGTRIWRLRLERTLERAGIESAEARRELKRLEKRFRLACRAGVY